MQSFFYAVEKSGDSCTLFRSFLQFIFFSLFLTLIYLLKHFKDNFMEELNTKNQEQPKQTIIIQQPVSRSNGLGTAGFVLALIALFLGWIPVIGWIVWLLGLIFSACGMFKAPRGLAIAGLVISLLDVILLLVVFGAVATALSVM